LTEFFKLELQYPSSPPYHVFWSWHNTDFPAIANADERMVRGSEVEEIT
jgi:hypothetical protein